MEISKKHSKRFQFLNYTLNATELFRLCKLNANALTVDLLRLNTTSTLVLFIWESPLVEMNIGDQLTGSHP